MSELKERKNDEISWVKNLSTKCYQWRVVLGHVEKQWTILDWTVED
jgi:hypothetical protein